MLPACWKSRGGAGATPGDKREEFVSVPGNSCPGTVCVWVPGLGWPCALHPGAAFACGKAGKGSCPRHLGVRRCPGGGQHAHGTTSTFLACALRFLSRGPRAVQLHGPAPTGPGLGLSWHTGRPLPMQAGALLAHRVPISATRQAQLMAPGRRWQSRCPWKGPWSLPDRMGQGGARPGQHAWPFAGSALPGRAEARWIGSVSPTGSQGRALTGVQSQTVLRTSYGGTKRVSFQTTATRTTGLSSGGSLPLPCSPGPGFRAAGSAQIPGASVQQVTSPLPPTPPRARPRGHPRSWDAAGPAGMLETSRAGRRPQDRDQSQRLQGREGAGGQRGCAVGVAGALSSAAGRAWAQQRCRRHTEPAGCWSRVPRLPWKCGQACMHSPTHPRGISLCQLFFPGSWGADSPSKGDAVCICGPKVLAMGRHCPAHRL